MTVTFTVVLDVNDTMRERIAYFNDEEKMQICKPRLATESETRSFLRAALIAYITDITKRLGEANAN